MPGQTHHHRAIPASLEKIQRGRIKMCLANPACLGEKSGKDCPLLPAKDCVILGLRGFCAYGIVGSKR
jgi:hypothetical protein